MASINGFYNFFYANKCENIYSASTEAMSDDNHFRSTKMRVKFCFLGELWLLGVKSEFFFPLYTL
jgi:hypothetical protein